MGWLGEDMIKKGKGKGFVPLDLKEVWNSLKHGSTLMLVFSNLFIIVFAILESWSIGTILFVFWVQSILIGLSNFFRILMLKDFSTAGFKINGRHVEPTVATKTKTAVFFAVHYGVFHVGYLLFIISNFDLEKLLAGPEIYPVMASCGIFLLNHTYSFISNIKMKTRKRNIGHLLFFPYARIIPMHLIIGAFSNFSSAISGTSVVSKMVVSMYVTMFLLLKTFADVLMHIYENFEILKEKK